MDDDKKKPARGGPRRGPAGKTGDRPRGDRGAKPYAARRDKAEDAGGARSREDRPKRDFRRDERPAGDGERKPFRKFDGEKKRFGQADGERKPFRKPEGKRPFARRNEDGGAGPEKREDRPRRDFRRDERPAGERKPFRKFDGEKKRFGQQDGERKPFRKPEGDRRQFREDGERKQFQRPRPDGRGESRPGKRERAEMAATDQGEPVERIAKRLARAGIASRRDAEELIAAGRVTLNGRLLDSPAVNVGPRDRIELDGKEIPPIERTRLFLFHKPAGVVTTNKDPEGRKTLFDILPEQLPRLMTVGRLDINTEGLLLLTNDGGLARVLELPATGWLRRYRVRVHGKVEPEALEGLKEGIAVDGVFYGGVDAVLDREQGSNAWLTVGLREGKNREVKNILGALGLDVTRLIRVSYGPFQLGELAEGEVRELKGKLLRDQLGERLIEEAGANFEAPVLNEFSNKPVGRADRERDEPRERPNRKREREERREDALDRLQTRPRRDGKPHSGKPAQGERGGGKGPFPAKGKPAGGKREERPFEQPRSRTSNVWMAPGARPMGEKKAAAEAARTEGRRYAGKPRPGSPSGKPGGRPSGPRKPRGER